MRITQSIILAGGLGTRLKEAVPDLPKCMAPVAGHPFIFHVIIRLQRQGIRTFIFSLGYMHEVVSSYVKTAFPLIDARFVVEDEPLGTGGAIRLACTAATDQHILVVNGDTLFEVDVIKLAEVQIARSASCTLALKPMQQFDRYGVVQLQKDSSIAGFAEKKYYDTGLINGGVYALDKDEFLAEALPQKFSFEKDYLEALYPQRRMYGMVQDGYFIDIGIPADFEKSNRELAPNQNETALPLAAIDKSYTLFLDRDGVLNHEKHLDYIHRWEEFFFYDGVKEALTILARHFGSIVVVTNQKGVGKGLTQEADLLTIHSNMVAEVTAAGGRIDKVYYCADLDENSPNRKPNTGMGLQAKQDFPNIDFSRAFMVGNTMSDMEFGRGLGMHTVFLTTTRPDVDSGDARIDLACTGLLAFAQFVAAAH